MAYQEKADRGDEEVVEIETLKFPIQPEKDQLSKLLCMACTTVAPPHGQNDGGLRLCLKNDILTYEDKRKCLTDVFDVVKHVQAEHDEHDEVGEEIPSDSSGKHHLVDL